MWRSAQRTQRFLANTSRLTLASRPCSFSVSIRASISTRVLHKHILSQHSLLRSRTHQSTCPPKPERPTIRCQAILRRTRIRYRHTATPITPATQAGAHFSVTEPELWAAAAAASSRAGGHSCGRWTGCAGFKRHSLDGMMVLLLVECGKGAS